MRILKASLMSRGPVRLSCVAVEVDGVWRIDQFHGSLRAA
jgi:hypothetical protein